VSNRLATLGSATIIALLGVVAVRNALTYPTLGGYDAEDYLAYARGLIDRGELPDGVGAYYTPPGFPALAGAATELGSRLGLDEPEHLGQLLNALVVVAAGVLVYALARVMWPARPLTWLAAVGFFAFFPAVVKSGAMFHPEPLSMLLAVAALFVLARMVRTGRYGWQAAVLLGALLGAGQLVRAWSLSTVVVAIVVLLVVALTDRSVRRSALTALAVVVAVGALVPSPWYVHQATRYSNPVFDQPQPAESLFRRRPVAFYVDARFPEILTRPWRDEFNDRFIPVFYTEAWGDYFGFWSWGTTRGDRTDARDAELTRQSAIGVLPTLLATAGVLALLALGLARPREDPARLVVALPPLAATGAVLYFAVAYPTNDGDTIKATYALAAVPALAVCFGFAFDRLAHWRALGVALGVVLVVSAFASLPFLVW
jgi:4-amino-4-deoxy-L-arabinose transferase-like glycosyltransferase